MKKGNNMYVLKWANKIYNAISNPWAIIITIAIIAIWFLIGIPMHYNDIWYKCLHTFEILVTLILVFIIEVTQKAEMKALQEKMDELIKKHPEINNKKAGIEKKYKGESK